MITSMARGVVQRLLELGVPGVRELGSFLLVCGTGPLWSAVWRSVRKAYDCGAGNGSVLGASLLRDVCESGGNRDVRLWALRELPALLADSRQLWEIALPALVTCRTDMDDQVARTATEVLLPVTGANASWARELLIASIGSATDRDVLLFAIPVTEGFDNPTDIRRAIDALFHCYENVLDRAVRSAIESVLAAHRRGHAGEYKHAEAEYDRRARSWIDRQILERSDERDGGPR
jgi:hypothetical protein